VDQGQRGKATPLKQPSDPQPVAPPKEADAQNDKAGEEAEPKVKAQAQSKPEEKPENLYKDKGMVYNRSYLRCRQTHSDRSYM
jgi:hypothetical protein